jgi:hypothetical protein
MPADVVRKFAQLIFVSSRGPTFPAVVPERHCKKNGRQLNTAATKEQDMSD